MSTAAVLRGREEELDTIEAALERAGTGRGSVVVIEGPAGQGKTRLLAEATQIARARGVLVGAAAATPADRILPFAPLLAVLTDPVGPLLNPSAVHDLSTEFSERDVFYGELQSLLRDAASHSPLLIALDDLHWSDTATISVLGRFTRALADAPIVWLLAARVDEAPGGVAEALSALVRAGARRMVLAPLTPDAVAQITADLTRATPGPALLALTASAGGNAFRLTELLAGLHEEDLVEIDGARAELRAARLPLRVDQTMRRRLAQLSPTAEQVATVAALLGRRFSFEQLVTAVGLSPSRLLGPTQELLREGIVVDGGRQLEFGHDLIRDAVLDATPPAARRSRQRELIDAQLAAGATPLSVAVALSECAQPGDEAAAAILLAATRALGASDPQSAADLSARTLGLIAADSPLRGPLIAETGQLLHAAGRIEESRRFTGDALRSGLVAGQDAEVRYVVAGMMSLSPDIRVDIGRSALELPDLTDVQHARLTARQVHNLVVGGRTEEALALMPAADAAAARVADATVDLTLALARAALAYTADRFGAALEHIHAARRAAGVGELARAQLAQQWLAEALTGLDEVEEADAVTEEGVDAAYRAAQTFAVRTWEAWQGRRLLQAGRLADARAVFQGLFALDATLDDGNLAAGTALVGFGRVALHTADEASGRVATRLGEAIFTVGTREARRHVGLLLALQAMARDDPQAARERLIALGEDGVDSLLPTLAKDVTDEIQIARIAQRTGDHALGTRARDTAARRLERNPRVMTIAGTDAHVRGLLEDDERALMEAITFFEHSPRPLALASALEDRGRLLVAADRREEAIGDLGRALELYAQSGASWDAQRARGRLRALGVRRRLVTRVRPTSGWYALTDAEIRVANLVADGLTNREVAAQLFLSPHTVSMHLRHAYAKLGVHTRAELTRAAQEHQG